MKKSLSQVWREKSVCVFVRCGNPRMIDSKRATRKFFLRNKHRLGQKSKALMKLTKFKSYIMERKMLIVVGFIVVKAVGRRTRGAEKK